ncbi:MAG: histidinol-phosphate aminotransferase family protein [Cyclobacteriaceae bacterium]|nr:histidinol-phosphate aminotransferase family protein [Cyclobacteriaceae bacterium]
MKSLSRRNLLKSGLSTLVAIPFASPLLAGAFNNIPLPIDEQGRIVYTPLFKENILKSYSDRPSVVRLNANENPYGPSQSAREAILQSIDYGNRYAWQALYELTEKIAEKEKVNAECIMMGPGSSDLLEKVAMVVFNKGGNLISADPCYMSIVRVAEATGAKWKNVPCLENGAHDLDSMEKAIDDETRLIYICNPNNPTGSITPGQELLNFCRKVSDRVPVFIDEAYIEFVQKNESESMVKLLQENKNVIIARTFSKVMGLAGMRIGYILALPSFLKPLHNITRGGMGITYPSVYAALAALGDINFQNESIEKNNEVKDYVYKELNLLKYPFIKSYTNFILFPVPFTGQFTLEKLASFNVYIRTFEINEQPYCRVSIGTKNEMEIFIDALKRIS